ncbi:Pectinesterase inhibitor [Artemisia annua]|uniref:Pectinesterase inhibitor n=1 Tax=Artemisia annua TaxID=35608 RepID=A0A2U1MJJ2_ARTAN|nr:Pectinesterase inhibitor [Artemisia annua]
MAQIVYSLLFFTIMIFGFSGTVESRSAARVYLEAQCRTTLYRDLCVRTLLPYASKDVLGPQQLAQVSLVVCLSKARTTKEYVNMVAKHFNETRSSGDNTAVEECLRQINYGVDQITLAVKEFQKMGKDREENFVSHEGNVVSWISAALTNADLCVDGLLGDGIGGREKATIKVKFMNVKQLASNSLAMFNRFTSRHRASHIVKNP